MVRQPGMQQLTQRIAASFHLTKMDAETVQQYIMHRLRVAGGTGLEFTSEACKRVYQETGGTPRLVNQLCDFAMLYAWSAGDRIITAEIIQGILDDGVYMQSPINTEGDTI